MVSFLTNAEIVGAMILFILAFLGLFSLWGIAKVDAAVLRRPASRLGPIGGHILSLAWIAGLSLAYVLMRLLEGTNKRCLNNILIGAMIATALTALPAVKRWVLPKLGLNPHRLLHTLAFYGFCFNLLCFTLVKSNHISLHLAESIGNLHAIHEIEFYKEILNFVTMVFLPLLSVGWLTYRKRPAVAERLGLRRTPPLRTVGRVVAIYLATVAIMNGLDGLFVLLEKSTGLLLTTTSPDILVPMTAAAILYTLLSVVITPGVTEELLFRGAIQPRVGIFWASVIFTLPHLQYGIDGLTSVFVMSLILGMTARRYSLWTSMSVHGLNNLLCLTAPNLYAQLPNHYHLWLDRVGYASSVIGIGLCLYVMGRWCKAEQTPAGASAGMRYALTALAVSALIAGTLVSLNHG